MAWEFLGRGYLGLELTNFSPSVQIQCSYRLNQKLLKGMLELFLKCAHSFLHAFWELIFDK